MLETNYPSKFFLDVRFVLFGFDPISENKVRSKLVSCGGVDVGQYSQSYTHVIVDKLLYDDPKCVAARNDGKILVTALWVDHSFDLGMPVDATSIMYRPPKDLNGIPGAKNMIMCLTGYQRQDRDDIMTMAGLMGAQFSKPLVASKVTHLICYKFEGEKYELAKKMRRIKLVNHRWLEDCIRDWMLLPEEQYNKSGYELELMEAEAKDSEEETEDATLRQSKGRNINKSPRNLEIGKGDENRSDQVSSFLHIDVPNVTCQDLAISNDETSGQLHDVQLRTPEPRNNDVLETIVGCRDPVVSMNVISVGSPDSHLSTSDSRKVGNDLISTSRNAQTPPFSDAKFNALSYSRKTTRRFTLPRYSEERSDNITVPSNSPFGELKFGDDLENLLCGMGKARDKISSPCIEGSKKGTDLGLGEESNIILPQKRISEVSFANLKAPRISPDVKCCIDRTPSANCITKSLRPTSLVDVPPETKGHLSVANSLDHNSNLSAAQNSKVTVSTCRTAPVTSKSTVQDNNAYQKTPQTSVPSLSESIYKNPDFAAIGTGRTSDVGNGGWPQNENQDVECSSPRKNMFEIEKSGGIVHLNLRKEGNDNIVNEPPRKKMVAKKSFGSRTKLSATGNKRGSVYISETTSHDNKISLSSRCKETGNNQKSYINDEKPEIYAPTVDVEVVSTVENVNKSKENAASGTDFKDDETEDAENGVEYELEKAPDEKKSEVVTFSKKAEIRIDKLSERAPFVMKCDDPLPSEEGINGTAPQKAVCGRNVDMVDSTLEGSVVKRKVNKGRKRPTGGTKKRTAPFVRSVLESKEVEDEVEVQNETKDEMDMETQRKASLPTGKNENYSSLKVDNEYKSVIDEGQNRSQEKHFSVGKSTVKPRAKQKKINQKSKKTSLDLPAEVQRRVKLEPVCFILSGHRLDRKEFQQVIRRLKGRFCQDSHKWSYQATHFIAPDPIRRTEKFFAAAAAGRWILKTDYLTASNQAGKFLPEEPYEWHKNGLSQDGATNMEAPRKWRLLRERTGHGAFYGMRIIIYGDCIAPTLDTLKRVVKVGDGIILATAPPYTRFLDTGVDYAIVSPGMPRVDVWVQEFLKHQIPCVVADYLVEYVCKPGFSLERHVLYSTHTWAERSYTNLQSRALEIVKS
ncbi:BRCT domain-containing protein [Quillaja saponaria]|uniref:BRCT domain-containing protein n=1 Tax=Quillaja saponaria TaxID=32244 RepID=A0AAD7VEU7_QUISA|nr:BRCT domain-containing protein [Quillaja saponaria]